MTKKLNHVAQIHMHGGVLHVYTLIQFPITEANLNESSQYLNVNASHVNNFSLFFAGILRNKFPKKPNT